jgi:hypothetical protein
MYPSLTPRLVSSVLLIVPSLLSSRMLVMDRLAMFNRLQSFVHPPDVHETEQEAVVHGVLQAEVHAVVHVLQLELRGVAQYPLLQSGHDSVWRQWVVSGVQVASCA